MNEPKFTDEDLKWNKERSLLSTDNLRVPPSEMLALIARLEAAEVLAGKADKQLKDANEVIRKQNIELMQFHAKQEKADELAKAAKNSLGDYGEYDGPELHEALAAYEKVRGVK